MKEVTGYFAQKGVIFKSFGPVSPKELGSRKKIEIYEAVSVSKEYYAVFVVEAKSRFLKKNAGELIELLGKLIDLKGHNYKKRYLLISSPLCSKAKSYLEENKWSVENDLV